MKFIACTHADHAAAILEIFNEAIINSTALYDYAPRSLESMTAWFKAKEAGGYPVVGIVDGDGHLLGFASYGMFRAWPAYKYTVEHSVYVQQVYRGQGVATALMSELINRAREQQYHVMIGAIDSANTASIALHKKFGFTCAGTLREIGFKFGQWLDVEFHQLRLDTPVAPSDG